MGQTNCGVKLAITHTHTHTEFGQFSFSAVAIKNFKENDFYGGGNTGHFRDDDRTIDVLVSNSMFNREARPAWRDELRR